MQTPKPNLVVRNDTILGVCEALGEDFGFHPNLLRIVFASLLLLNPAAVVGTYLALGLLVALSRFLAPTPRAARPAVEAAGPVAERAELEPFAEAA
jgi:phage shock protein PspC (stress-responsive transcriptional regulator)